MKSTEFITESIFPDIVRIGDTANNQLSKAVEDIKINCQPFLNEIEDPFSLLRGLRPTPDWAVKKTARLANRQSMSTPDWLHKELNQMFVKRFRVPFRNAVFCTGNESQARVYGMMFAVFPIGNYKYAWSPKYRDLYQNFDNFRVHNDQHDFIKTVDITSYQTTGLNEAIASGHEIMLYADSYYALNMNHIWTDRNSGPIQNAIQDYLIS